jgi:hypothetical protein
MLADHWRKYTLYGNEWEDLQHTLPGGGKWPVPLEDRIAAARVPARNVMMSTVVLRRGTVNLVGNAEVAIEWDKPYIETRVNINTRCCEDGRLNLRMPEITNLQDTYFNWFAA